MKKRTGLFILLLLLIIQIGMAQTRQLTGTVTDKADKSPLPGVTVMIKGTATGVATDLDGRYSIPVKDTDIVIFSFVGMQNQERPVKGLSTLNIELVSASQTIDEVVVIGYGVRKKGSITGSVSTVKADKLENTPVASFDQALQGQAPGLQVISNSGQPNAPATFTLRGVNSINAGSSPLFILDGIQISSSDFSSLNPGDIESINVLKDASSTAIYGARATNGVILITTKRGKVNEKARITARAQVGVSNLAYGKWDMMNTREKLDYEEEVGFRTQDYNREELEKIDVDWRDAVFTKNALMQNYELSISGATPKTSYYISGGVHDQEGITFGTDFNRYSIRVNLDTKANDWLKAGVNMTGSYETYSNTFENQPASNTPLGGVRSMNPYWSPYKPDGSIASMSDGTWKGDEQNPLEFIRSADKSDNKTKFIGTAFLELTPVKGLTLKSLGGVDLSDLRSTIKNDPDYVPNHGEADMAESFARTYTLQISNTAEYSFSVENIHNIRILLGQEANNQKGNSFGIRGNGYTDKRLIELSNATHWSSGSSSNITTTFLSFFGRAEYNFDEKYYIDATFRRDGSSRFGENVKWGNFWSVGAMWNLKKEAFLIDNNILSNAQVSASIGTQGNSFIPDYMHLATISPNYPYGDEPGTLPTSIGNPDLTWEKTRSLNIGFRAGLINRININLDFYHKMTSDMLMVVPQSMTSGFSTAWDNVGKMTNNGFDFDINADLIRDPEFYWNLSVNFSYNKSKIKDLYNNIDGYTDMDNGIRYQVDHRLGEHYYNRFAGVNPANGDPLWYTKEGDITNQLKEEDMVTTGKYYISPWSGGFATSLGYKGISLSAQFSWIGKHYLYNNDRFFTESNGRFIKTNQSKTMLYDRWKKPGDITNIPRHGETMQSDDRLLENAAFLRLKNLTVSYSLPKDWMQRTKFIESIRLYAQAQNLFTITKFKGFDPEATGPVYIGQYPLARQFTFGLEANF